MPGVVHHQLKVLVIINAGRHVRIVLLELLLSHLVITHTVQGMMGLKGLEKLV
jgi:hypothetical protein